MDSFFSVVDYFNNGLIGVYVHLHGAYMTNVQKFDYGYTRKLFNKCDSHLYISHSTWVDFVLSYGEYGE